VNKLARLLICQICREKDVKENMEVYSITSEKTGKTTNKYYHKGKCWEKFIKEKEESEREQRERDELDSVLRSLFNIKVKYPDSIWWMIEDLRNGTNRFQKFWKKKYKKGYPYSVIAEAYRMSKDDIEWARLNRHFKDLGQEMRYSLKIIQSKLEDAYKKRIRTEQSEKIAKAKEESQLDLMFDNREVEYKKKDDGLDMSDILGD